MDKLVYIIAGEPSGDFIAGRLMWAVRDIAGDGVDFCGIGGEHMQRAGLESLFPMEELSVMGVAEILPRVPALLKKINQTVDDIISKKPDVLVTVDSPDFCFRVIKALRKRQKKEGGYIPKIVHYVAPTVWAWRSGRAKKVAGLVDGIMCLFDFEPPYFEREGLRAVCVGHPVVESGVLSADGAVFKGKCGIDPNRDVLGLFFGSRRGEVKRMGGILRDCAIRVFDNFNGDLSVVVPTLPHLEGDVREILAGVNADVFITTEKQDKWNAFKACDAAIAVSGTVGLELAVAGVPHVIGYRMSPLTWLLVKMLVRVDYAHLVNIMSGEEVVPEFIQKDCSSANMSDRVIDLLRSERKKEQQMLAFHAIRQRVGGINGVMPSVNAAEFVLSFLDSQR